MLRRILLLFVLNLAVAGSIYAQDGVDSYIKVEARGKLQTGVVAIGAETTGYTITTKGGTLELDLSNDRKLRAKADKLNGKTVVVTGTLTVRRGVEVRQRLIVMVATLKPVKG